ncbi:taurine dioxygenase, partial [Escherichia coli]
MQILWQKKIRSLFAGYLNRPGFPGECFICELRLPDHRFRWKHNKLFLLLP